MYVELAKRWSNLFVFYLRYKSYSTIILLAPNPFWVTHCLCLLCLILPCSRHLKSLKPHLSYNAIKFSEIICLFPAMTFYHFYQGFQIPDYDPALFYLYKTFLFKFLDLTAHNYPN